IGFAKACNIGVKKLPSFIDTVFLLNPDVILEQGCLNFLRQGMSNDWASAMPLLLTPDGLINSAGNVAHTSGLSWSSSFGDKLLSKADISKPKLITAVSGACMLIRRKVWDELGGFNENYFMYYEDTDLSVQMLFRGYKIGLLPKARVVH